MNTIKSFLSLSLSLTPDNEWKLQFWNGLENELSKIPTRCNAEQFHIRKLAWEQPPLHTDLATLFSHHGHHRHQNCDKIHLRWFVNALSIKPFEMVITNHPSPVHSVQYAQCMCVVRFKSNLIAKIKSTVAGKYVDFDQKSRINVLSLSLSLSGSYHHYHHSSIALTCGGYATSPSTSLKINLFVTLTRNQISINLP